MMGDFKDFLIKKVSKTCITIANLVCDTIILIVALGCFKLLDSVLNYFGYTSELSGIILRSMHNIIILALCTLSIEEIFIIPRSMKKPPNSKRVLELVRKNDSKSEIRNLTNDEINNDISNQDNNRYSGTKLYCKKTKQIR